MYFQVFVAKKVYFKYHHGMEEIIIRQAHSSDFESVVSVMDKWWGRPVSHLQHELFFNHFNNTAFIAETSDGKLIGFINGFLSQTESATAYVHFVGADPQYRANGLGKKLYETFFKTCLRIGCSKIKACTSKANVQSMEFHKKLGFSVDSSDSKKFRFEIMVNDI